MNVLNGLGFNPEYWYGRFVASSAVSNQWRALSGSKALTPLSAPDPEKGKITNAS